MSALGGMDRPDMDDLEGDSDDEDLPDLEQKQTSTELTYTIHLLKHNNVAFISDFTIICCMYCQS